MVPEPRLEKISLSIPPSSLPSRMCTRSTPAAHARRARCSSSRSASRPGLAAKNSSRPARLKLASLPPGATGTVSGTRKLAAVYAGVVVRKKSFSAPSVVATTTASSLEEMLYGCPDGAPPDAGEDGHDALLHEGAQRVGANALHDARALVVHPVDDPDPAGPHPVADHGRDPAGREHGHDPVGHVEGRHLDEGHGLLARDAGAAVHLVGHAVGGQHLVDALRARWERWRCGCPPGAGATGPSRGRRTGGHPAR